MASAKLIGPEGEDMIAGSRGAVSVDPVILEDDHRVVPRRYRETTRRRVNRELAAGSMTEIRYYQEGS